MSRRFFLALLMLALFHPGLEVQAAPPEIRELPEPVVGSVSTTTGTLPFVYPDAINLNQFVSDDATPPDQIKWSYAIVGTPVYAINGVDPLDLAQDDPTSPGLKQINGPVRRGEFDPDGKVGTITIRNTRLQPFSGAGDTPAGQGITDTQVATLFASDGTSYSMRDLVLYTDLGGQSRLSGSIKSMPVATHDFLTSTCGWRWDVPVGAATSSTTKGICIATPMSNGGMSSWTSPWGLLPLVDNAVYRIRMTMNFTQAQAGARCPFWDVNIQNYAFGYINGSEIINGYNLYGGDNYFFDNEGGANAVSPGGKAKDIDFWWCPSPIRTPQWKAGVYTPATQSDRNALMQFRVIDFDMANGIVPYRAGGTLCLARLAIDRYDLDELTANRTQVYNASSFTPGQTASAKFIIDPASRADFSGGLITATPGHSGIVDSYGYHKDGQYDEYCSIDPGDTQMDWRNPDSIPDNFPLQWEPQTLYEVQMALSAPNAQSEMNPWDAIWLQMDSPTNELITESYVTSALNQTAMPKQGTPQIYTLFYWSGNGTKSIVRNFDRLRWRLSFGNNPWLDYRPNTGSLRLHGVTVNKIKLPGNLSPAAGW